MLSAENFCKQFGTRSGPTESRAWSGSNLFDTQMVFLKYIFEKIDFEKNQQTKEKHEQFPRGAIHNSCLYKTMIACYMYYDKHNVQFIPDKRFSPEKRDWNTNSVCNIL